MKPINSRGYRNRNPGNIIWTPRSQWPGLIGKEPGQNGRFCVFVDHEHGFAAAAQLLKIYQDRHKLETIRGIISRWAPPTDNNNTAAYIAAVARSTGFTPDQRLNLHTYGHLRPLTEAIITHELGGNPYNDAIIDEGLRLAGVARPGRSRAARRAAAVGVSTVAVGQVFATISPHLDRLTELARALGPWLLAGLLVVIAAWLLWHHTRKASS